MRREAELLLLALQFLTRLPTPSAPYSAERAAASLRYYPLVGALIGALAALVYAGAAALLPPGPLPAILAVAAAALLTGALHEDGLADTFDGVGGGRDRAAALEIMRDSRLGAFGALALMLALALKLGALAALAPAAAIAALVLGHSLSRLVCVLEIATNRYARATGAAEHVAAAPSVATLAIAAAGGGAVIAGAMVFGAEALAPDGARDAVLALLGALTGLALGLLAMRRFYSPKLGGYTGDTLGAAQQASEIGLYLGLLAALTPG